MKQRISEFSTFFDFLARNSDTVDGQAGADCETCLWVNCNRVDQVKRLKELRGLEPQRAAAEELQLREQDEKCINPAEGRTRQGCIIPGTTDSCTPAWMTRGTAHRSTTEQIT